MTLPPASTGTSPPDMGGSALMGGPVLAGLEDSSSVPPGPHRVKDAPQTGEAHRQPPVLRNCPGHRAMARLHGARDLESPRGETPAHPSPGGGMSSSCRGGRGPAERRLSCRFTSQSPGPTEAHTPVRQTPAQSWVGMEMQAPFPAHPRGCLETGRGRRPSASWEDTGLQDPTVSAAPDNKGRCSTWGADHFSTFDGLTYDVSGTCNYVFAAVCEDAPSTFSVQLRRGPGGNISRIIVELGASAVTVQGSVIAVKDVG